MAILVLLRHGRTRANAEGTLAGWTPGIGLDERGREQAAAVGRRLMPTPLVAVVASPLQRCQETACAVLAPRDQAPQLRTEEDLGEARYGAWTGRPLKELAREPLWKEVQRSPSTVHFPPHDEFASEGMAQMQARAVAAARRIDSEVEQQHGPGAVWLAVSHGDVIKSLLADALATPLDDFQRIVVDPASVSIVRYTRERPYVLRLNDSGSDPVDLTALSKAATPDDDAAVGGGAGSV
ncbi:MSMEG_4193 family putative phosphomutase [Ornithinimicrobium sediminis]|uniref:MSMEG_4193 family putative phosphomutase n=1 Tax=Ornithinimicrobium sediminis TaxID=2904603 RepID=UPI001E5133E7|nr:MSMEG_4193 family putative phosphomutase [Ornithinimicrobium sediminis]MCE0487661.1 MSMEG_4193 family putative phosphomutase [Ornithinimicrobium sediminis]